MSEKFRQLDIGRETLEEFSVGQRFLLPFNNPLTEKIHDIGVIIGFENGLAILQVEGKVNVKPRVTLEVLRTLMLLVEDNGNMSNN